MTFRELLKQNRPVFGIYVVSPDPNLIEIAAHAGLDYIRIDLEHGMLSYSEVREIVRVATLSGMPVQARVSDLSDVTRLLDFGVTCIIVPDVDSVESAKNAVNLVKYTPLGNRGFNNGARFLKFDTSGFMDYIKTANEEVLLGIQIESRQAVEKIDEILSVDGIDMVSSGKGDLSQSYGLLGQNTHPLVLEKEAYIIHKAIEHGRIPTVLSTSASRTKELAALGCRILTLGNDMDIYASGIRDAIRQAKH